MSLFGGSKESSNESSKISVIATTRAKADLDKAKALLAEDLRISILKPVV